MTIWILVFSFLSFTVTPWSQEHFNLEEQTVKFHRFVIAACQHNGYSPSRIFNNCTRHQCSLNYYHPVALSDSVTIEQFLWNAVVLRKNELHRHTKCGCWWEETVTALSDLQGCVNSQRPWLLFHQQGWTDEVGKLIKVTLDFFLSVDLYKWTGEIQCKLAVNFYKQDTEFFFVTYNEFYFYFFFILSNGSVHAYWEVLQLSGVVGLGLNIPFSLDRASEGTFGAATDWCSSDSPLLNSSATDFGQVPEENMWRHYLSWLILGPFEFTPAGKKKKSSFPKPGPSLDKAGLERYS